MKGRFLGCIVPLMVLGLSSIAFGADSPIGTWKWKDAPKNENVLHITRADAERVTGTFSTGAGFGHGGADTSHRYDITGGSFKDGVLTFTVEKPQSNGSTQPLKFTAKLQNEKTMKGKVVVNPAQPAQGFEAKKD